MPLIPGVDYPTVNPVSSPITINNDQNTPTTLFTIDTSTDKSVTVEYSIVRATTVETGRILIASDGTTFSTEFDKANNSDTGVSLMSSMSLGIVSIQYISTNTGQTGTFKYSRIKLN